MSDAGPMRELVSLGVIIAGCVVGLHLLVGEPLRQRAERTLGAVIEAQNRLDEIAGPLSMTTHEAAMLDVMRTRAREIAVANTHATDQLRVYGVVTDIAGACGVQIDRMEPASGASAGAEGARAQAYEISAVAPFPALVEFLDRVQRDAGFTIVTDFSFEPEARDGRPLLRATIRTVHYAFDLGEATDLTPGGRALTREDDE
jgi:hypothetical protein